jgi:DNA-directed RNA polymerase specialized sigma24 family protein
MDSPDSVTHWIAQLRAGERSAAGKLWEAYFSRLVQFARKKLHGVPRRMADEEDVALSAFDSFCRRAEQGRFPDLADRDNLWPLLLRITERKAIDLVHHQRRVKRGLGRVRGDSAVAPAGERPSGTGMDSLQGKEPSPDLAAQVSETVQNLLARLPDADLRAVALSKMEGYTNAEIAEHQACAVVTVERRLRLIRSLWQDAAEQDEPS